MAPDLRLGIVIGCHRHTWAASSCQDGALNTSWHQIRGGSTRSRRWDRVIPCFFVALEGIAPNSSPSPSTTRAAVGVLPWHLERPGSELSPTSAQDTGHKRRRLQASFDISCPLAYTIVNGLNQVSVGTATGEKFWWILDKPGLLKGTQRKRGACRTPC